MSDGPGFGFLELHSDGGLAWEGKHFGRTAVPTLAGFGG